MLSRPEPHSSTSVLQRQKKAAFCGDEVSEWLLSSAEKDFFFSVRMFVQSVFV